MITLRNLIGDLLDHADRLQASGHLTLNEATKPVLAAGNDWHASPADAEPPSDLLTNLANCVRAAAVAAGEPEHGDCHLSLRQAERFALPHQKMSLLASTPSEINPTGMAKANRDVLVFNGLRFYPIQKRSTMVAPLPEAFSGFYEHSDRGIHLYDPRTGGLRAYLVANTRQGHFAVTASAHPTPGGGMQNRYMHSTCSTEESWLKLTGAGLQDQSDLIRAIHFLPLMSQPKATPSAPPSIRVRSYGDTSYWPPTMDSAMAVANEVIKHNGCGLIEARNDEGLWKITHRFSPEDGIVAENNAPRVAQAPAAPARRPARPG